MPLTEITTNNDCEQLKGIINKDRVIIFYYMNGCGFCELLKPIFAKVINNNRELVQNANIFKIERTHLNLLPETLNDVRGFPYIISYKYEQNTEPTIVEFNSDRTEGNIQKFISENSSLSKSNRSLPNPQSSSGIRRKKMLKTYPRSI